MGAVCGRRLSIAMLEVFLKTIVIVAICLFVGLGVVAAQNSSSDVGARVLALDNSWNHALEANDTKALDLLLADSFVSIDIDGSIQNKVEFLASLKSASYQVPSKAVTEQSKADVYGASAVVVGVYRSQFAQKGKSVTRRERFLDTWVNIKGTWRCVASVAVLMPGS